MIVNLPADAVPASLLMYPTEARDTTATSLTLTSLGGGRWSVDTTGLSSRWYPTVVYTLSAVVHTQNLPYVDLPEIPDLVVSPETLAKKAKIPLPLSTDDREQIIECIRDAQADVTGWLGREIMPAAYSESGRYDVGGHWNLQTDEQIIDITQVTAELSSGQPTGLFTITYIAGINAKDDPLLRPIVRYVTAHAMNSPEFLLMWKTATKAKGDIKSVTTEGQSITWDKPTLGGGGVAGSGAPGALPTLKSIDRWRIAGRRVFQRAIRERAPWPYSGYSGYSRDIW